MNAIPFAVSFTLGLMTALGLRLLVIPLSLGELGGPIDWSIPFLGATGLMLAVATCAARAKGLLAGAFCGILFSAPIAAVCFHIPHTDPTILREHGSQLKLTGVVALTLSVMLMGFIADSRQTPPRPDGANDKEP